MSSGTSIPMPPFKDIQRPLVTHSNRDPIHVEGDDSATTAMHNTAMTVARSGRVGAILDSRTQLLIPRNIIMNLPGMHQKTPDELRV
eukprot:2248880-Rhodomonas_salina.2